MGFPSPAQDYIEQPLSLNDLCIARPSSTHTIRMPDDSMAQYGILKGAVIVLDRSIEPKNGDIFALFIDGEIRVGKLANRNLLAGESALDLASQADGVQVWGVATWVINILRQKDEPDPEINDLLRISYSD